jgi:DNA-binding CsgD family transcriptional regulator
MANSFPAAFASARSKAAYLPVHFDYTPSHRGCTHTKSMGQTVFSNMAPMGGPFVFRARATKERHMSKRFAGLFALLLFTGTLTGCGPVGEKAASIAVIYAATAVLAFLLLAGCICSPRTRRHPWLVMLFSSVFVVDLGYTFLALSNSLEAALWANRVSYLGSVFLPLSMLMILLDTTGTAYSRHLPKILLGVSVLVFLVAATPGFLPIYYKEVSFAVVDGVATLVKVYGPLHPLYLVYLLGYFCAMVAVLLRAQIKKTIRNAAHGVILTIAVFVNIGVWFIEQLVSINFEILSVSYIMSELFLLGVHLMMGETQRLRELVQQVESVQHRTGEETASPDTMRQMRVGGSTVTTEQIESFVHGLTTLTPAEKAIYDSHVARLTSREIMAALNIKETTLKYHNRNIYSKLGVSTRKELLELEKHLRAMQVRLEESSVGSDSGLSLG